MSSQMVTIEQATWAWIDAAGKKHSAPLGKRFVKAIMAGFLLSMGGMLTQILSSDPWLATNAPGLLKIIQGCAFPVGLVMIVLLQAELVTSEMAIFIISTMKRRVPYWAFLYGWAITFVGNLVGSLLYASVLVHFSGIYTPDMATGAAHGAESKMSVNFLKIFLRGIGCNVLVCIAVFQASLAKDVISKIVAAWFPIATFVSAGFDHVVANMFIIPEGLLTGKVTMFGTGEYIWKSVIASFLGNTVGAAFLVVPLVYLYGGDEFDPARTVDGNSSVEGTIHNVQLQPSTVDRSKVWSSQDVEKQISHQSS
ncbi:Formate/nitrite transporter [Violaceomyces palustris]|uniref:Formate/nitrite transporter n=1 Tax=Violaceomyces palustris TaxID=1673888 RepID=A0ACD0NU57_9BASI|nr:Formate/nitrite transporter [Violaceomyces palustris]